jgi:GNAT superfamily N-acetyltransferase
MDMPFVIRPAIEADVHAIILMIREFAEAEARPNRVTATEALLRSTLFSENPIGEVLLAVDDTGEALGYALVYRTFVPYIARPGLFLKNLFIRDHAQRKGLGKRFSVKWLVWRSTADAAALSGTLFRTTTTRNAFTRALAWTQSKFDLSIGSKATS